MVTEYLVKFVEHYKHSVPNSPFFVDFGEHLSLTLLVCTSELIDGVGSETPDMYKYASLLESYGRTMVVLD